PLGSAGSERNIVVHVREVRGHAGLLARRRGRRLLLLLRRRTAGARGWGIATVAAALGHAAAFTAAQHLHLIRHDFRRVALLAVLALPFAGLQAAFHVHRAAFFQVFTGNFLQAVVEHHTVPFRFFTALSGIPVFPVGGGGGGHVAGGLAIRAVANLRVTPQITHQNDFVHGSHCISPCVSA